MLDRDRTGASRADGTNPYTGLDNPDGQPFLFNGEFDIRVKAMQRMVAIESNGKASAWALDAISGIDAATTAGSVGGSPVVTFWKAGQSSALEQSDLSAGRDVGAVGVFSPSVADRTLEFVVENGVFVDAGAGTTWSLLGEAVVGEVGGP